MAKRKAKKAQAAAQSPKPKELTAGKNNGGGVSKILYLVAALVGVLGVAVAVFSGSSSTTTSSSTSGIKKKARLSTSAIIARGQTLPCKDRHDTNHCAQLSASGECDRTPGWMSVMCAASCDACVMLDPKIRCDPKRMGMSTEPAVGPGDIDKLFEVCTVRHFKSYFVHLARCGILDFAGLCWKAKLACPGVRFSNSLTYACAIHSKLCAR
jgi:hypothetical protein